MRQVFPMYSDGFAVDLVLDDKIKFGTGENHGMTGNNCCPPVPVRACINKKAALNLHIHKCFFSSSLFEDYRIYKRRKMHSRQQEML